MSKHTLQIFILGVVLVAGAPMGFAEKPATDQSAPPEMTAEQKKMHERMMAYGAVNENHEFLKNFEGSWKTNVKFWMDPNGPSEESEGTSEGKMVMDGRFLEHSFKGTAMGQPFEGRGITGYNNMKKEFTTVWFDSMATGVMTSSGKLDAENKTIKSEGTMACPVTDETERWYRDVLTLIDKDHYKFESYTKDKDGKEYKGMEINYTRQ